MEECGGLDMAMTGESSMITDRFCIDSEPVDEFVVVASKNVLF